MLDTNKTLCAPDLIDMRDVYKIKPTKTENVPMINLEILPT